MPDQKQTVPLWRCPEHGITHAKKVVGGEHRCYAHNFGSQSPCCKPVTPVPSGADALREAASDAATKIHSLLLHVMARGLDKTDPHLRAACDPLVDVHGRLLDALDAVPAVASSGAEGGEADARFVALTDAQCERAGVPRGSRFDLDTIAEPASAGAEGEREEPIGWIVTVNGEPQDCLYGSERQAEKAAFDAGFAPIGVERIARKVPVFARAASAPAVTDPEGDAAGDPWRVVERVPFVRPSRWSVVRDDEEHGEVSRGTFQTREAAIEWRDRANAEPAPAPSKETSTDA